MRACVPTMSMCQHACVVYVPTCQRGLCANMLACQRGWRANVLKACQLFIFSCQRVIRRAIVPTCQMGCQFFQTFLLESAKENFYTLLLQKKFCILLDILVIYIVCICIINRNCIILCFYTSCYIKEKCVEFFLFSFCSLVSY